MKINNIKLQNYRQYKDVKVDFSTSENQNITIIQGSTGDGKTNFLNAITWCLYGKEKHLDKSSKGLDIYNTSTMEEAKPREIVKVGVQIELKDDEGTKIILARGLSFEKTAENKIMRITGSSIEPDGSVFKMIKYLNNEAEEIETPNYVLGRMIPESIQEYFFFNGERLEDYFKEKSGEKIRSAVFRISQLFLLENAIEHLERKKTDFIRESGKLTPRAEEIRIKLSENNELLKKNKKSLEELINFKSEAEKNEKDYSDKLRGVSVANIEDLETERNQIEKELEKTDEKINELENEKFDYLIEIAPLILTYEPIYKMKRLIDAKEDSGDIPPDYKRNFIDKLLSKGECICGNNIKDENEGRKRVRKLLEECDKVTDICQELIEENREIAVIIKKINSFKIEQENFSNKIRELENDRKIKSERLQIIHELIGKSNIEEIRLWEEKLTEYKNLKDSYKEQIILLNYQVEETKKIIAKENDEFEKELTKEKQFNELRKILTFCEEGLKALESIKTEIMEDVRKEIETKTKEQFIDMMAHTITYKDINIDGNYNISVVHQSGQEGRGTLSQGEKQILAYAFTAALNSVSGFNVPIVIDTPLGRIAGKPRMNIINALPAYLGGRQLLLLVTDTEYTSEVREKLSQKVGKEYIINFKETENGGEANLIPYEN